MASACAPNAQILHRTINQALKIGRHDSQTPSISHPPGNASQSTFNRTEEEVPIKVAQVIGELPRRVMHAAGLASSSASRVVVAVMELNHYEYPGPAPRSSSLEPENNLNPAKLQYAGAEVWSYLTKVARLSPKLKYVMNNNTKREELWIVIELSFDILRYETL